MCLQMSQLRSTWEEYGLDAVRQGALKLLGSKHILLPIRSAAGCPVAAPILAALISIGAQGFTAPTDDTQYCASVMSGFKEISVSHRVKFDQM